MKTMRLIYSQGTVHACICTKHTLRVLGLGDVLRFRKEEGPLTTFSGNFCGRKINVACGLFCVLEEKWKVDQRSSFVLVGVGEVSVGSSPSLAWSSVSLCTSLATLAARC